MQEAFLTAAATGGDFFVELAKTLFQDPDFQKSDPRRQLVKNGCVPLDTMILTKRGWLRHDEVQVGDETIGLNLQTRRSEWTSITQVHHYTDATVYRYWNKQRWFETTDNHRWVVDTGRRATQLQFCESRQIAHSERRMLIGASHNTTHAAVFTDQEVRVLAWALTDGSIDRGVFVGAPSQGRNGDSVKCAVCIYQMKPEMIVHINELLSDVPHKQYKNKSNCVRWRLSPPWARSVLERADVRSKHDYDAWQLAFKLTESQRVMMLEEMWYANGGSSGLPDDPQTELTIALMFLTGHYPRVHLRTPEQNIGWQRHTCASVLPQKPRITGQRLQSTLLTESTDVWCVTTELGSWTMRQAGNFAPMITGNSYAKIYGAGIPKFASTVGIPETVAADFMQRFDIMFPRVPSWITQTLNTAMQRKRTEGEAYVRSPLTGRRHTADNQQEYALINYLVQGLAGEILKLKIIEADAAGLGNFMLFPVHDEIDFEVPTEDLSSFLETLADTMNDSNLLSVPITWSADTGPSWGECR
jgi:hypothetical protein